MLIEAMFSFWSRAQKNGSETVIRLASLEPSKQKTGAKSEFETVQNTGAPQENKYIQRGKGTGKSKAIYASKSTISGKSIKGIQSGQARGQTKSTTNDSADDNSIPRSGLKEKILFLVKKPIMKMKFVWQSACHVMMHWCERQLPRKGKYSKQVLMSEGVKVNGMFSLVATSFPL